jgi:hypothetical protein
LLRALHLARFDGLDPPRLKICVTRWIAFACEMERHFISRHRSTYSSQLINQPDCQSWCVHVGTSFSIDLSFDRARAKLAGHRTTSGPPGAFGVMAGFRGPMNGCGIHVDERRSRRVRMSRHHSGYF